MAFPRYGLDPKIAEKIMTPQYLDNTVSAELNSVHHKYAPNSQLWVGEAAAAWHSGADGVTNAFTSSFWWSDALGALAAHNHTVYCRQTLLGGNYGLLNRTNYQPVTKTIHICIQNINSIHIIYLQTEKLTFLVSTSMLTSMLTPNSVDNRQYNQKGQIQTFTFRNCFMI